MRQSAITLKRKGHCRTRTDSGISEPVCSDLLMEELLPENIGWNTDLIVADTDAVIAGMYAKDGSLEIEKARKLMITLYCFPAYIYRESISKTWTVTSEVMVRLLLERRLCAC